MFVNVSVTFSTDHKHNSLKKKRIQGIKTSASFHFYIKKYAISFFHGVLGRHRTQKMKRDLNSALIRDFPNC